MANKSSNKRKNINVSIQSKKYNDSINNILNTWEEDGLNISTEVCESILLANKIDNSPTLLSVMKIYDLAYQILSLNKIDNEESLENILSSLIKVNGEGLTEVISNSFKNKTSETTQKQPAVDNKTTKNIKINNKDNYDDKDDDTIAVSYDENIEDKNSEYLIPDDYLFND